MGDLTGSHVLVVEDEYFFSKEIEEALSWAGAQVIGPFPSAERALAALESTRPDCAVVDIRLEDGMNFDLPDALCSYGVAFLFYTACDAAHIPSRFAGVKRIEKSVDRDRLTREVASLCEA